MRPPLSSRCCRVRRAPSLHPAFTALSLGMLLPRQSSYFAAPVGLTSRENGPAPNNRRPYWNASPAPAGTRSARLPKWDESLPPGQAFFAESNLAWHRTLTNGETPGSGTTDPRVFPVERQAGRLTVTHTIQAEARNSVQVALLAGVSQKSPFHRDGREGIGPAGIERRRWDAPADQKKIASRPGFLPFK